MPTEYLPTLVDQLDVLAADSRRLIMEIRTAYREYRSLDATWDALFSAQRGLADIVRQVRNIVSPAKRPILDDEDVAELIRESRRD